ncbi:MAG: hypothetical protein LBL13_10495 [Bacteroidales bacterium]|jgi:hypothetical protein|nr:hypothetical protein [Bacteroidales bacterium]
MKKVILLTGFIVIYSAVFAQKQQYKLVEGELGLSMPFGMPATYGEESLEISPGLYGEIRFNIPNRHLSVGAQLYITGWTVTGYDTYTSKRNTIALNTVFDYNFNEIKGFLLPFAGFGIGLANLNESSELYISPRIGVEVWNRLRFSFGYNFTAYSYSGFVVKLGFVVGGGKKK